MGRLFYNIIGSVAEFEREMIVERVNAGLANAKAKGIRLGRPEKDPSAPERILSLREEGWSLRQIARRENLTASGVLKILRRAGAQEDRSVAPAEAEPKPEAINIEPSVIPQIWQLKIYLTITKPQIWRRVLVPSEITLAKLSDVIQKLFGWTDLYHHEFVPRDSRGYGYSLKCDENTFRLSDVGLKPGDGMLYDYGSLNWTHEVEFEKPVCIDEKQEYPVCIAGAMAAPPDEWCSDVMQYIDIKKTRSKSGKLKNMAKSPGLKIYCIDEWFRHFDPYRFDLDEINERLGVRSPEKDRSAKQIESKQGEGTAPLPIPEVYQFRVSICDVRPEIWRRVLVHADSTLEQLSDVIQVLFDWSGGHLHRFNFPGSFGVHSGSEIEESAEDMSLAEMRLRAGDSLLYEYDFGDCWMHEIVLEEVCKANKRQVYPVCVAGKNAGPPEDCGGPEAYSCARGGLKKPRGKKRRNRLPGGQRDFYKENYPDFDPDKFDKAAINRELRQLD